MVINCKLQPLVDIHIKLFIFFSMAFSGLFPIFKAYLMFAPIVIGIRECFYYVKFKLSNVILLFIFVTYILFSSMLGVINGYEFKTRIFEVYILAPIIMSILAGLSSLSREKLVQFICFTHGVLVLVAIAPIAAFFTGINILPDSLLFGSVIYEDGKIMFRTTAQNALMFTTPVLFMRGFLYERLKFSFIMLALLTIVIVALGGRRALQLVLLLTFLVIFFKRPVFGSIACLLGLFFTITFVPANIIESIYLTFVGAFDGSQNSASVKYIQGTLLLEKFSENPMLGHGVNAYIAEYLRHPVNKYAYELFYHALLMQIGLVGIIILALILVVLFTGVLRAEYSLLFLVSFLIFLLVGATNPLVYLPWFWLVFFLVSRKT